MGCTQLFGDAHAFGDCIDADNRGRAFKACTRRLMAACIA
jgi:hypothetical protein